MIYPIVLFLVGLSLSAFFSGSETGLYRVTRVRLVIDALGGDRIARSLLWMTNHPSVFVATVLIGNNLANYLVSLSVVMGMHYLIPGGGPGWELLAPVLLAPLLFIYGEAMPKIVFFESPNRMLRCVWLGLIVAKWLLMPATALLWVVSRSLERILGQSPPQLRLGLARWELAHVLEEGHAAGILRPSQRSLAQGLFTMATLPIRDFATQAGRIVRATTAMDRQQILRLASRHRLDVILIEDATGSRDIVGYVRIVDLYLDPSNSKPIPRPLAVIPANESFVGALMQLQQEDVPIGCVVEDGGRIVGYVTVRQLSKALFRGQ
ncbi:MAG: DUF21 domain-containing protein [Pirellulales bacterium]|nr:DUF21 domain-containing protein [Pirellulales bacterium]